MAQRQPILAAQMVDAAVTCTMRFRGGFRTGLRPRVRRPNWRSKSWLALSVEMTLPGVQLPPGANQGGPIVSPAGSFGPPQGSVQIGSNNGMPVFRGVDGQTMFTIDPATGAVVPFTGTPNNAPGVGTTPASLAQGPAPAALPGVQLPPGANQGGAIVSPAPAAAQPYAIPAPRTGAPNAIPIDPSTLAQTGGGSGGGSGGAEAEGEGMMEEESGVGAESGRDVEIERLVLGIELGR
jgi:hypothetical protein